MNSSWYTSLRRAAGPTGCGQKATDCLNKSKPFSRRRTLGCNFDARHSDGIHSGPPSSTCPFKVVFVNLFKGKTKLGDRVRPLEAGFDFSDRCRRAKARIKNAETVGMITRSTAAKC
jgi:hypothetical protein